MQLVRIIVMFVISAALTLLAATVHIALGFLVGIGSVYAMDRLERFFFKRDIERSLRK